MFLLQLKYETLRLMRSPALWMLMAFLAGSVGLGLYNGSQRVAARQQSIGEMLGSQQTSLEKQKAEADSIARGLKKTEDWWLDPTNVIVVGGVWEGGWVTAIDPAPQTLLAVGMSDLQPDVWRLTLMGKEARGDSEFENPVNLMFGTFDLAFVMAFLLPLLVVALSFNLISAEREQGTLSLQWAQPVGQRELFLHKTLARFLLLTGMTLLIVLPALAGSGISLASSAAWMTAATAVLYVFFWFLLALGINLLGGSSAQNALRCMGTWLAFTLIIPALVNMLAQKIYPVPSRAGFQTAMRDLDTQLEANREQRLSDFYRQHPELTQKPEAEKEWQDWYREDFALLKGEKRLKDSLEQAYADKATQQADFSDKLTLLSPALSVYRQMTDIAGTSRRAYQASVTALDGAQQNWAAWFLEKFDAGQSLTVADYETFMKFPDRLPLPSLPAAWTGAGWLLLQCLMAGLWSAARVQRKSFGFQ
ncbi:MAG: ABC transporter permease subunit [Bacteroidia bacterium]|nr:ABC transporter permease subunit [Bacteroidia bacterium]